MEGLAHTETRLLRQISKLEERLDLMLSTQRPGRGSCGPARFARLAGSGSGTLTPTRSPAAAACVLSAQRRLIFDGPSPYHSMRRESRCGSFHPGREHGAVPSSSGACGVVSGVGSAAAAGIRCMSLTNTVYKGVAMAREYRRNGPSAAAIDAVVQLRGALGQLQGAAVARLAPALMHLGRWGPAGLALASSTASSAGSAFVATQAAARSLMRRLCDRVERQRRSTQWLHQLLSAPSQRPAVLLFSVVVVLWARDFFVRRRRRPAVTRWVQYEPHVIPTAAAMPEAAAEERTAFALSILAMPFPATRSTPQPINDLPPTPVLATVGTSIVSAKSKRQRQARRHHQQPLADYTAHVVNGATNTPPGRRARCCNKKGVGAAAFGEEKYEMRSCTSVDVSLSSSARSATNHSQHENRPTDEPTRRAERGGEALIHSHALVHI